MFAFVFLYAVAFSLTRVGIVTDRAAVRLFVLDTLPPLLWLGIILIAANTLAFVGYGRSGVRGALIGAILGAIAAVIALALLFSLIGVVLLAAE